MPTLSPGVVAAGGTVTVASAGFTSCGSYAQPRTYSMTLATTGRQPPVDVGTTTAATDGSFSAVVTIPLTTAPGEAAIQIEGSDFDKPCNDGHSSCASYGRSFQVVAAPTP